MTPQEEVERIIYSAIQGSMGLAIKTEAVMAGLKERRDVVGRWLYDEPAGDLELEQEFRHG